MVLRPSSLTPIVLAVCFAAAPLQAQTKYSGQDGRLRVALSKQPFSPNGVSKGPDTMATGGIQDILAKMGAAAVKGVMARERS